MGQLREQVHVSEQTPDARDRKWSKTPAAQVKTPTFLAGAAGFEDRSRKSAATSRRFFLAGPQENAPDPAASGKFSDTVEDQFAMKKKLLADDRV